MLTGESICLLPKVRFHTKPNLPPRKQGYSIWHNASWNTLVNEKVAYHIIRIITIVNITLLVHSPSLHLVSDYDHDTFSFFDI